MKSIALSAVFASALLAPAAFASGMPTPAASRSGSPVATQELPRAVTRSGREFIAHCDDEAFASARFPRKLADRCARLLATWHAEAGGRGNATPVSGGIDRFGAPRGIPFYPPATRYR